jgi:hypothetical protein|tara:strand:- start:4320 stop:4427 length:108 start_codon:yes stop_codon:yes gene_type:complete
MKNRYKKDLNRIKYRAEGVVLVAVFLSTIYGLVPA